jgi:hypothetical protein
LNIVADAVFPESLIRKVGDNGEPISGAAGKVSVPFHTHVATGTTCSYRFQYRAWRLTDLEINGLGLHSFIFICEYSQYFLM